VAWLHTEVVYPPKEVTHPSTNSYWERYHCRVVGDTVRSYMALEFP